MTPVATTFHTPHRVGHRRSTSEPPAVRRLLIGIALAFMALFLVLPLVFVFSQAFAKGIGFYFKTLNDPLAWSAIKLTLLSAAIAVPFCAFTSATIACPPCATTMRAAAAPRPELPPVMRKI